MQGDNAAHIAVMSTNAQNAESNTLGIDASMLTVYNQLGETERAQLQQILNSPPVTPVRVSILKSLLANYDPNLTKFLIDGFSFGFRIGFVGSVNPRVAKNLRSAEEQPHIKHKGDRRSAITQAEPDSPHEVSIVIKRDQISRYFDEILWY